MKLVQKNWNLSPKTRSGFKIPAKRSKSVPKSMARNKFNVKKIKKRRGDIKSRSYFNGFFRIQKSNFELGEEYFKLKNQRIIDKKMESFEFFKKKG